MVLAYAPWEDDGERLVDAIYSGDVAWSAVELAGYGSEVAPHP